MQKSSRTQLLRLALVPALAAIVGGLLVLFLYWQSTFDKSYSEQIQRPAKELVITPSHPIQDLLEMLPPVSLTKIFHSF